MPIPNVGLTAAGAPDEVGAIAGKTSAPSAYSAAAPQAHGWFVRTAALAAEDLGQWFGGVFHRDPRPPPLQPRRNRRVRRLKAQSVRADGRASAAPYKRQ